MTFVEGRVNPVKTQEEAENLLGVIVSDWVPVLLVAMATAIRCVMAGN